MFVITHDKMVERKMETEQVFGLGIGGCKRLCPTANGHSLVTLFPYLCRLRNGRCNGRKASHRSIVLSTYLGMGAGKTCCSLVVDPALSRPTD